MPETYAVTLDKIRECRLELGDRPLDEYDEITRRTLGEEHWMGCRALPEDFLQAIDLLPTAYCALRSITLLDINNPQDLWRGFRDGDYFCSQATHDGCGHVTFFKKAADQYLITDVLHEWAHSLRSESSLPYRELFDFAASFEVTSRFPRSQVR